MSAREYVIAVGVLPDGWQRAHTPGVPAEAWVTCARRVYTEARDGHLRARAEEAIREIVEQVNEEANRCGAECVLVLTPPTAIRLTTNLHGLRLGPGFDAFTDVAFRLPGGTYHQPVRREQAHGRAGFVKDTG